MMAVRKNNVETVKLFLDRNADVTVTDSKDKTVLYVSAEEVGGMVKFTGYIGWVWGKFL